MYTKSPKSAFLHRIGRMLKSHMVFSLCICVITGSFILSGCAGTSNDTAAGSAEIPDELKEFGEITVITREEGSGTREVFAEKTGLLNENSSSDKSDIITENATVANNAESVISMVQSEKQSIGFVSLGALYDNPEGIKILKVNGIAPDSNSITNNTYAISRNLNIAYSGKLTEQESDFLRYIMSEGQSIASENYTPVKTPSDFLSDNSTGEINISGSTSVAPLLESLAEDYRNYNPNVSIKIKTTDSTLGLNEAMSEASDWGMASRELKDYEKELLTWETIAKDGVAVIINADNPLETLSVEQLYNIFSGADTNWSDI